MLKTDIQPFTEISEGDVVNREDAEKVASILKEIKSYEAVDSKIHRLYKEAESGDKKALEDLANLAFELTQSILRELTGQLSKL